MLHQLLLIVCPGDPTGVVIIIKADISSFFRCKGLRKAGNQETARICEVATQGQIVVLYHWFVVQDDCFPLDYI